MPSKSDDNKFTDITRTNWHKKHNMKCPYCDRPLRPAIHSCDTAKDMNVLVCTTCTRFRVYSPIAYFILANFEQLNCKSKYNMCYEDLAIGALKEEGM